MTRDEAIDAAVEHYHKQILDAASVILRALLVVAQGNRAEALEGLDMLMKDMRENIIKHTEEPDGG